MKGFKEEKGFSLIEMLVALSILSVSLLAIGSMVFSVMQGTSLAKQTTAATALAQDKLEALKHGNPGSLTSGNDSLRAGEVDYSRRWTVSAAGNLRTLTVTVSWSSRGPHQLSAATLVAN
jgi:type II secretion system protein I